MIRIDFLDVFHFAIIAVDVLPVVALIIAFHRVFQFFGHLLISFDLAFFFICIYVLVR